MVVRPYFTEEKQVLPFDKIIELEKIDNWTFRSIVKAYSPTGHNITGWFILGGKPDEHFTYKVKKIRDGYNYCTRSVNVNQIAAHGVMFTCTCSFKREEGSVVDVQDQIDLKEVYRDALEGIADEPMEHEAVPSVDSEKFNKDYLPAHPEHFNPLPGLHIRKPDMTKYNAKRKAIDRRKLHFYSLRGSLPLPTAPYPTKSSEKITLTRDANMHACAHLYASDRNSLFLVPNHLDRQRDYTRMASLSHSVIFHVGIKDLIMTAEPRIHHSKADPTLWEEGPLPLCNLDGFGQGDKDGRKWYVQEAHVARATGGRALHTSRLWDYDTGVHIATTFQDGLVRFKSNLKL
ncbi:thioesterase-like superfamily-domain-containing protein [Phaeosphaeria sp. MPI-PUGE-AT-0046c]|nr:thioesterase-like superfamily-domain-containing protein [Phaeosphaeria sp. MPI-PUGE-AT-0046c]